MPLEIYTQINTLNLQLHSLFSELLATLEDEHQLLQQQDPEALPELALIKKQLSEQISTIEQQRTQLIKQTGLENKPQDLDRLSEMASSQIPDFADNWLATAQLIQQCADKNQINGIIMQNNRRTIETRLSILRGQPLAEDSYTRRGKKSSGSDSRYLTQV